MEEFGTNPDIDEKPPISLRDDADLVDLQVLLDYFYCICGFYLL